MQINDAFIPFCGTGKFLAMRKSTVDGGQRGRWPEVKECKRGGAGQLHTPAPAIAASLQVYVSTDVAHA